MAETVSLGFEIDTSGLAVTEAALNRIAIAAERAKKAIEDLGSIKGARLSFEAIGEIVVGTADFNLSELPSNPFFVNTGDPRAV